ncbi:hypothetical protein BJ742DRAFT_735093 [Cladochytrium replicatum]|nr:hypothetical protein BJ742DRAFT_735093 [Cladochytrium replicatum]
MHSSSTVRNHLFKLSVTPNLSNSASTNQPDNSLLLKFKAMEYHLNWCIVCNKQLEPTSPPRQDIGRFDFSVDNNDQHCRLHSNLYCSAECRQSDSANPDVSHCRGCSAQFGNTATSSADDLLNSISWSSPPPTPPTLTSASPIMSSDDPDYLDPLFDEDFSSASDAIYASAAANPLVNEASEWRRKKRVWGSALQRDNRANFALPPPAYIFALPPVGLPPKEESEIWRQGTDAQYPTF